MEVSSQGLMMDRVAGVHYLSLIHIYRFLRKMVVPGYIIVLAMLAVTLTLAPLNEIGRASCRERV